MNATALFYRLIQPLRSRKVRVALATVVASIAAAWGLELREDVVYTILGVGTALILGIAHEDTARALTEPPEPPPAG